MNNGPALTHRSAASAWPRGRPQASAQERIPLRWRVLGGAQSLLFCFWLTAQALPWVPFPSSLSTFAATSSARGLELFTALPRPIPVTCAHRPVFASTPAFLRGAGSLCSPPFLPTPTLAQPKCFLPPSFAVVEKLSNSL